MKTANFDKDVLPRQALSLPRIPRIFSNRGLQLGLIVLASMAVGLVVIVSTYYAQNFKLVIGLVGGFAFVLLTVRWPEFNILCLVALFSGLIKPSWLPAIRLGPVSLQITDIMLLLLLGLVFLRATTQARFVFFGSPLMLPLFLFLGAILLSALNAVLIYGVSTNDVFFRLRVLSNWIIFFPTLQLVRDDKALRRLLIGLLILGVILASGVLLGNRLSPLLYMDMSAIGENFNRIYYSGDMVLYAMIPVTVASLATIKKGNQLWRIGLLGLLLYWAYRTYFREYWLTLLVTCFLLVGFFSNRERLRLLKRMTPALVASVVVVVVLVATHSTQIERAIQPLTNRLESLGQNPFNEGSWQWRANETRYALLQIGRHPVLGIGLGNAYRPPMGNEEGLYFWAKQYIENGYLYIAVMMGLVGLLPFLWLCAVYLLRVFRHQHEIRDDGLRAVYLGFGAAFLGMVVCNLLSPTFVIEPRLVFFPVSMAISENILRIGREKQAPQ